MTIDVAEEPMTALAEYALLPIACRVAHVLDVTARADGSFALSARRLQIPYVKDYDAVDGEGPLPWTRRFDVSNWQLFTARVAGSRVGGATEAFNTPGVTMLGQPECPTALRGHGVPRREVVVSSGSRRRTSMCVRIVRRHGCELRAWAEWISTPIPLALATKIQNLARHPFEFYRKVGFAIVGLLPDANGFGKPDIFMAKRVSGGAVGSPQDVQ
jgi:hypothetical protein